MKKLKTVGKAMAAIALGAGLLVGGAGVAMYNQANPLIQEVPVLVEVPVITEKVINNTVEVPVEVIKEVEVEKLVNVTIEDESFKVMACDRLAYEDLSECVEEVKAEDFALNMVLDFIENDFDEIADELEDKGIVADEDEVEVIKVYNDYEDIEVIKSDFDDEEYKFKIKVKIEDTDDDVKKYILATLKVEDNEVTLTKVVEE